MGQQAGGASVHYHMLSPITRGLFNRAVSMSGSALAWWASIKRPQVDQGLMKGRLTLPLILKHMGVFFQPTTKIIIHKVK